MVGEGGTGRSGQTLMLTSGRWGAVVLGVEGVAEIMMTLRSCSASQSSSSQSEHLPWYTSTFGSGMGDSIWFPIIAGASSDGKASVVVEKCGAGGLGQILMLASGRWGAVALGGREAGEIMMIPLTA